MTLHANWIPIQLKRNGMQIGGEGIENLHHEYDVAKNNLRKHISKKTSFHASLLGNGLNIFQFGIV